MILRSKAPELGEDEKRILNWFEENFGLEDTATLASWVWDKERNDGKYVAALWHIAGQMKDHERRDPKSGRRFVQNLVEFARKPRVDRDAEVELAEHMREKVAKGMAWVRGHREDQAAKDEIVGDLRRHLREKLRQMWPDKHRATIDGALMVGLSARGGKPFLDFAAIVKAMNEPDPLATNARVSHAVAEQ